MPQRPPMHRPEGWRPAQARAREYDRQRNTNPGRVMAFSARWRRESKAFLAEPGNGICRHCREARATVVDHRQPHGGDAVLFWDRRNWVPSCNPCNSAKAARDEGGFGNPTRA